MERQHDLTNINPHCLHGNGLTTRDTMETNENLHKRISQLEIEIMKFDKESVLCMDEFELKNIKKRLDQVEKDISIITDYVLCINHLRDEQQGTR